MTEKPAIRSSFGELEIQWPQRFKKVLFEGVRDSGRNFATVLLGTVVAQAIPLAVMPALTRLYSVEDFGAYNVWLGLVSILVVLGSGRMEMALFASETNERDDLLGIVILCSSALAILVPSAIFSLVHFRPIPAIIHVSIIPLLLVVFFVSIQSFLLAVLVRSRSFFKLGWAKLAMTAGIAISQLVCSLVDLGARGLIWGHLIGTMCGMLFALVLAKINPAAVLQNIDLSRIANCLKRHWRFPLFSIPADLTSALTGQLPVFLVAGRFDVQSTGYMGLTFRALSVPIGLIAASVLDVFKERASTEFRERGNCRTTYIQTFIILATLAVFPFAVLAIFGESLFSIIFGAQWKTSGKMAVILTPLFCLRFVFSPLSYTVYITGKQHLDFLWQLALSCVVASAFLIPSSIDDCILAYSIGYAFMYIIYGMMSFRFAKGEHHDSRR